MKRYICAIAGAALLAAVGLVAAPPAHSDSDGGGYDAPSTWIFSSL